MRTLVHLLMALAVGALLTATTPVAAAIAPASMAAHCDEMGKAQSNSTHQDGKAKAADCCLSATVSPAVAPQSTAPMLNLALPDARPLAVPAPGGTWAADPPPPKSA